MAMAAQELINSHSDRLMRKVIWLALKDGQPKGQIAVLLALVDRIVPVRREAPVNIGSLPTATISEVSKSSEALVKKATSGKLTIRKLRELPIFWKGVGNS